METVCEYKGAILAKDPETGELWDMYDGEKNAVYASIEQWKYDIDHEDFFAGYHSCYQSAHYIENGPAGAGEYCQECGRLIKLV